MSEKPEVEELLSRLDEVLTILKQVVGDLQEISKSLRSLGASQPSVAPAPSAAPLPKPSLPSIPATRMRGVEDVKMMFPDELEGLLNFTEEGNFIKIKPRQYLGSDNFAKIASIIRGAGGEYISAGKDSHFRIPKEIR
jgi:hypothetical protein